MTARRQNYLIGVLGLSAVALIVANVQLSSPALADQSVANDEYQLVTGRTGRGDEALYILNRPKNLVAIFTWDESRRTVAVRDVRSLDTVLNATQAR